MNRETRSNLAIGIILILLGAWFLAVEFIPGVKAWANLPYAWPMLIIGVGIFLLILGLILRVPGLAVPACIVGGIGGILYWQNSTGNWASWAYAWTLIPGFVGVGSLVSGLLGGDLRSSVRSGIRLILISLVLFVLFWIFLSGSGLGIQYWPVLLVLLGLWIFIEPILRRRK